MIEIDCPECGGDGEIKDNEIGLWVDCQNCDTKGKIKVYTEAEFQKAIKKEREACALVCEEIREKSIDTLGILPSIAYWNGRAKASQECLEAIRERGRECDKCHYSGDDSKTFTYLRNGTWSCPNCGSMWTHIKEVSEEGESNELILSTY